MKAPTRRLHQPLDPADYRRCDSAQIAGPASFVGRPSSGTLLGPLTGALPTPPVGALVLFGGAVFGAAGEHSEVGELLAVLGAELVALGTVGDTQCVEFVPVLLTEFGELRATAPRPRQLQPPHVRRRASRASRSACACAASASATRFSACRRLYKACLGSSQRHRLAAPSQHHRLAAPSQHHRLAAPSQHHRLAAPSLSPRRRRASPPSG